MFFLGGFPWFGYVLCVGSFFGLFLVLFLFGEGLGVRSGGPKGHLNWP